MGYLGTAAASIASDALPIVDDLIVAIYSYSMKPKKQTLITSLVVVATIGLALAPVIADQFRPEVARWYLAEATNRIVAERDNGHQLEQARRWAGNMSEMRDYWIFRAEQALADSPEDVAKVVAQAVAQNKLNFFLADSYSQRLADHRFFKEAVAVLEAGAIPELEDSPQHLNNLAYFRALAGIDLDQALVDINRGLESDPDSPGMRDTRGWVLFQMGNPLLALEDADFAVSAITPPADAGWLDRSLAWLESQVLTHREPQESNKTLTRREAGEQLWIRGTLMFHRAKILEALGRTEEAERDFQWLRERHLPTDDSIF